MHNVSVNYGEDHIYVLKNIGFIENPLFQKGYNRAIKAAGRDFGIRWRFHTCLWAAQNGLLLEGDFVECGVGRGFMSSGIMEALDFDQTQKSFYLFDTFDGLVKEKLSTEELEKMKREEGGFDQHAKRMTPYYAESYDAVVDNFSSWQRAKIIKGMIPETLKMVDIDKVAYLHIDLNCVGPEIDAITFFYDKLSKGAVVVLDDYAYFGYDLQYNAWNSWAKKMGITILSLPTGQGIFIK
ncbi:MAG: hypothetical protein NEHIOOID_00969 [Holosporales bacterium]